MPTSVRRMATILAATTVAMLGGALPALAHVTPQPDTAAQGDYAVIAMRVPNESDTAGTVKLEVTLPTDHPITSVRTTPIPGWTATTVTAPLAQPIERYGRTITEAVQTVTWTANPGVRISPGEFVDFPLSLGPLPSDTDTLMLPAVQTYDDGEVVAWNQPTGPEGAEPEHPAPIVTLTPATGDGHTTPAAMTSPDAPTAGNTDSTARWLGGTGFAFGALGLGIGIGALLRSRRPTGGSA